MVCTLATSQGLNFAVSHAFGIYFVILDIIPKSWPVVVLVFLGLFSLQQWQVSNFHSRSSEFRWQVLLFWKFAVYKLLGQHLHSRQLLQITCQFCRFAIDMAPVLTVQPSIRLFCTFWQALLAPIGFSEVWLCVDFRFAPSFWLQILIGSWQKLGCMHLLTQLLMI